MLMGIWGILTSCGRKKYEPAPIPEGVELTGFYLHHEGMVMEPYYILKVTNKGGKMNNEELIQKYEKYLTSYRKMNDATIRNCLFEIADR